MCDNLLASTSQRQDLDDLEWFERPLEGLIDCSLPPHEIDRIAVESKALQRRRVVRCGMDLVKLCLLYSLPYLSFRSVAAIAESLQLALTDDAVRYRLRQCETMLARLVGHMLERAAALEQLPRPTCPTGMTFALLDGSTLQRPGTTSTDQRLHLEYDPQAGYMLYCRVTDATHAEGLDNSLQRRDALYIGDANYGRARQLAHAEQLGMNVLLRTHLMNIRLEDEQGKRIDPEQLIELADAGQQCVAVTATDAQGYRAAARLIIFKLPEEQAERAREEYIRQRKRKKALPDPQAVKLRGYITLLTNLDAECIDASLLVVLYALRWQIELAFKRYKSLLALDELHARSDKTVRVEILAKLFWVLLVEAVMRVNTALDAAHSEGRGSRLPVSLWRLTAISHLVALSWLLEGVAAAWFRHVQEHGLPRSMSERKRKRRPALEALQDELREMAQMLTLNHPP